MTLVVLAYPEIAESDYERIQNFRKHHDELYYRVVEPHFTLVFPLPEDWSLALVFLQETTFARLERLALCETWAQQRGNDNRFKEIAEPLLLLPLLPLSDNVEPVRQPRKEGNEASRHCGYR